MNKNIHFPESLEMPNQEITRWKQRVQEKEKEKKTGAVKHTRGTNPEG